jgi:hypothetical protein
MVKNVCTTNQNFARLKTNSINNTGLGFPTVQLQIVKKVAGLTQNNEKTIGTPNQPIRTKIFLKAWKAVGLKLNSKNLNLKKIS